MKLLPHSILITKGSKQIEIDSLPNSPVSFHDFHVGAYTVNNIGRGLTFSTAGNRHVEVEVWTWKEGWSWKVVVRKDPHALLIAYNAFQKNRIERIMSLDYNLKLGMSVAMTFKSLKKLGRLNSFYLDIDAKPIDNPYSFRYKKNGKLNKKKSLGEIRICDCNVF